MLAFLFIRVTSFISWRYGRNLVEHGVGNWNPAGSPVEAYTNPLYTMLSIVPAVLGFPAELFFKIVSLLVLAGFVLAARRAGLSRVQRFILLAIALASPIFYLQLFIGLETVSFALLIAYVVAVWAVYGGLRWWYFGDFFPNTFYKKTQGEQTLAAQALHVALSAGPVLAVVGTGIAVAVWSSYHGSLLGLLGLAVVVIALVLGPGRPRSEDHFRLPVGFPVRALGFVTPEVPHMGFLSEREPRPAVTLQSSPRTKKER